MAKSRELLCYDSGNYDWVFLSSGITLAEVGSDTDVQILSQKKKVRKSKLQCNCCLP